MKCAASELTRQDQVEGSRIARVIFAGNTLATPVKGQDDRKIVNDTSPLLADFRNASVPEPRRPT